jgi:hypothetical protein
MPVLFLANETRQSNEYIRCRLERSHLSKKSQALFLKALLIESGMVHCVANATYRFARWRRATNAFGRWITEALHPPVYIKDLASCCNLK